MAKAKSYVSASEQAAIGSWVGRHWLTFVSIIAGLIAARFALYYAGLSMTFAYWVILAGLLWLARWRIGIWWWTRNRRRVLIRAHRPAPTRAGLKTDRRLEKERIIRVAQQWPRFCEVYNYRGIGKVIPRLSGGLGVFGQWRSRPQVTASTDLVYFAAPGKIVAKGGVDRLRNLAGDLGEAVGCQVSIRRIGQDCASITFMWSDPLARVLPIADMPATADDRIAYGIREDGSAATIDLPMHTLVGGMSGFGKSNLLWDVLTDLIRKGIKFDLHVIDPKGGSEFFTLEPNLGIRNGGMLVASYCGSGDVASIRVLDQVVADLKTRQAIRKNRKWTVADAEEQPLTILLIDECLEVFGTWSDHKGVGETTKGRAMADFTRVLLSQGRAAGFMVLSLTQTAEVNALGPGVRRLYPQRVAVATDNAQGTDMILGEGSAATGAACSKITEPGLGFSRVEGERGFARFRAALVTEADTYRIAAGQLPEGMNTDFAPTQIYYNYRFYTSDKQPLRTGITNDFERRYAEYTASYTKEKRALDAGTLDLAKALHQWFQYHDPNQTVITEADSRAEAKAIESQLIATGVWRGNHQENMTSHLRNVPPPPGPRPRRPAPAAPPAPPAAPTNVTPIRKRPSTKPAPGSNRKRTA